MGRDDDEQAMLAGTGRPELLLAHDCTATDPERYDPVRFDDTARNAKCMCLGISSASFALL